MRSHPQKNPPHPRRHASHRTRLAPEERAAAHRRAVLAYQKRHLEAGLCMVCPRPAVSAYYCERHRRQVNAQRRTSAASWRCGLCGGLGHNRRTCPQAKTRH